MITKTVSYKTTITFIVDKHEVIEVHSSGRVVHGKDDRASDHKLIELLIEDAQAKRLHSQQA